MDVSLFCFFRLPSLTHPPKGKLYLELFDVTSDLEQDIGAHLVLRHFLASFFLYTTSVS